MPFGLRKFLGTLILLVFVPAYALFAMSLASLVLADVGPWLELGYFLVAGVLWVLPAGLIVLWMFRPARTG